MFLLKPAFLDPLDNCLLHAGVQGSRSLAPAEQQMTSCSCARPAAPHFVLTGQMLTAAVASAADLAALQSIIPSAAPALLHHALQESLALLHAVMRYQNVLVAVYSRSTDEPSVAEDHACKQDLLS